MKKLLALVPVLAVLGLVVGSASAQDFSGGVCTGKYKHLSPSYLASYCAVYGPTGTYTVWYNETYGKGGEYCVLYGYNC